MDLEPYASTCIEVAIYGMDTLDIDALRGAAMDARGHEAENATIYTHKCLDIIREYERDVDTSDYTCGEEARWKSNEWEEAMTTYAHYVADAWIGGRVEGLIREIDHAAANLAMAAESEMSGTEPRVSQDCPHGWAVHDREDDLGVHYWEPDALEGCRAVAVKVAGIWLSYTWTPQVEGV